MKFLNDHTRFNLVSGGGGLYVDKIGQQMGMALGCGRQRGVASMPLPL